MSSSQEAIGVFIYSEDFGIKILTTRVRIMAENKLDEINTVMKEEEDVEVEVEIWKYIFGFVNMGAAKCAIELGIADVIENHKTPITLSDLASITGCEPSLLHRLMRFLVHERVFKEEPTSQGTMGYVQTPLSRRLLRRGGENSMADFLLLESSSVMLAPWHRLSTQLRAISNPAFQGAHGKDVWEYAEADSAHSKLINDAMASDARIVVPAILEGCREVFNGVSSLVDVGGGNGTALSFLVKACPWMTGINFDLPHVVSAATECSGVQHVSGDMFDNIPKADAAFIMWVLHDWGDDECIQILKNCREAVGASNKGKVIIVEAVIKENGGDKLEGARLMVDMIMMAHTTQGKERTLKEWDYVLKEAGFSNYNINPIRALQSVIEAFP